MLCTVDKSGMRKVYDSDVATACNTDITRLKVAMMNTGRRDLSKFLLCGNSRKKISREELLCSSESYVPYSWGNLLPCRL